jgi:hypothetical protein
MLTYSLVNNCLTHKIKGTITDECNTQLEKFYNDYIKDKNDVNSEQMQLIKPEDITEMIENNDKNLSEQLKKCKEFINYIDFIKEIPPNDLDAWNFNSEITKITDRFNEISTFYTTFFEQLKQLVKYIMENFNSGENNNSFRDEKTLADANSLKHNLLKKSLENCLEDIKMWEANLNYHLTFIRLLIERIANRIVPIDDEELVYLYNIYIKDSTETIEQMPEMTLDDVNTEISQILFNLQGLIYQCRLIFSNISIDLQRLQNNKKIAHSYNEHQKEIKDKVLSQRDELINKLIKIVKYTIQNFAQEANLIILKESKGLLIGNNITKEANNKIAKINNVLQKIAEINNERLKQPFYKSIFRRPKTQLTNREIMIIKHNLTAIKDNLKKISNSAHKASSGGTEINKKQQKTLTQLKYELNTTIPTVNSILEYSRQL